MLFTVSHPGRHETDRIEADSDEQAIEIFRERHGKIQSNHEYTVVNVAPVAAKAPVSVKLSAKPAVKKPA